jgi:REP element-mobilizing transposase RayT
MVSRNSPCYYLTSVARNRLPIFRTDTLKLITCAAMDEARKSGKSSLYAYVIMPDHLHVITNASLSPSKTLQFINGIISRRIIGYLKERAFTSSLRKLLHEAGPRGVSPFVMGSSCRRTPLTVGNDAYAAYPIYSSESRSREVGIAPNRLFLVERKVLDRQCPGE